MRDPARIDRILELLRGYWFASPDMRLGQVVEVLAKMSQPRGRSGGASTFYVEDDVMEAALRRALEGEGGGE